MSDNQEVLSYLEQTFAIQPEKMVVQYQPVSMTDIHTASPKNPDDPLDVLWAGRLDRLKRPDLVLEIARRCQDDNIFFHVYGTSVIKGRGVAMDGHKPSNLKYHGPFDGLRSLQPSRFDLFLNTSQWDGMPNILLEATAEGLPIVSSDVGGIGELIIHNETGLLVSPFDDVDQYVVALRRLKNDPELRKRLLLECRKLVSERHSWRHFVDDVNRLPGYLEAPCQLEQVQVSLLTSPHIDKEQQATRP